MGLFLYFQLKFQLSKGNSETVELAGIMVGKSEKTICEWRQQFLDNDGEVPGSKQGHYRRSGVLWNNESLNKKASLYIRNNANVKGKPNLHVANFVSGLTMIYYPTRL